MVIYDSLSDKLPSAEIIRIFWCLSNFETFFGDFHSYLLAEWLLVFDSGRLIRIHLNTFSIWRVRCLVRRLLILSPNVINSLIRLNGVVSALMSLSSCLSEGQFIDISMEDRLVCPNKTVSTRPNPLKSVSQIVQTQLPVADKHADRPLVLIRKSQTHAIGNEGWRLSTPCLLYTSPSPRDQRGSRMPSSA